MEIASPPRNKWVPLSCDVPASWSSTFRLTKASSRSSAEQVTYLGVYDGHGGEHASHMLQEKLHKIFEDCTPLHTTELLEWYRQLGGFFKRYKGGSLSRISQEGDTAENLWRFGFGLDQRAALAFLEADRQLFESKETGK